MKLLHPFSALMLLGIIPIILLYLLKNTYEPYEIASNYLWKKTLSRVEAIKPWEKLRKNLLLLLQLLIFTLIVFAMAKPYLPSHKIVGQGHIILIDNSASMGAIESDNKSRLDLAKDEAISLVKSFDDNVVVTVVTTNIDNETVVMSSDKKELIAAIKRVELTLSQNNNLIKDYIDSLISNEHQIVFCYSDQSLELDESYVDYYLFNKVISNQSIINVSTAKKENSNDIIVTINSNIKSKDVDIILYDDEEMIDIKTVNLNGNGTQNIIFDNGRYITKGKVKIDSNDDYKYDNVRYFTMVEEDISEVLLLTNQNVFLEKALFNIPNVELYKTDDTDFVFSGYDLYVFDSIVPNKLPAEGSLMSFNHEIKGYSESIGTTDFGIMKEKNDPLFDHMSLSFYINKSLYFKENEWSSNRLFMNNQGIVSKGQKNNQRFISVGFDLFESDLPLSPDFPIFMQNSLDYLLGDGFFGKVNYAVNEQIKIVSFNEKDSFEMIKPTGKVASIDKPFYTDTESVGVYQLKQNEKNEFFVVNIDSTELLFEPEDIQTNQQKEDVKKVINTKNDIDKYILIVVLILLIVEWMVYISDK